MIQRLKEYHNGPVLTYIPNSLTSCRQKTEEEVQVDIKVKELLDEKQLLVEKSKEYLLLKRENITTENEKTIIKRLI